MATYADLHNLRHSPVLLPKIHVAIAAVAVDILAPEANTTAARTAWAKEAIIDPAAKTPQLLHYVLIKNAAFTHDQIRDATDASVKTAIAEAVDKIVGPKAA